MVAQAELGFPVVIRPSFTMGGTGGGIAYNREEFETIVTRGLVRVAHQRSAARGIGGRLERVRDGGRARPQRQLHHRLLDREPRSDGRAHRRLDHRGAGADADRQGIPAHARRLDRGAAQDRRGDRRLERAVRRQSGRWPAARHRDESARVALVGAGLEGHRLSDRQDRRQAGRGLHARRAEERHHRRTHAGVVRALDRLRGHQDSALHLREVPGRQFAAHHADEVGGRGDGHRPHLPGIAAEGAAWSRDRSRRSGQRHDAAAGRRGCRRSRWPTSCAIRAPTACCTWPMRSAPAGRVERMHELSYIDPWFLAQIEDLVREEAGSQRRACRLSMQTRLRAAEAQGLFRQPSGTADGPDRERHARPAPPASACVPVYKRVDTCAAEFATSTAYLYSTYEEECEAQPDRSQEDHDPGRRTQPHRAGHRVRLLLRACRRWRCARMVTRPSWSTAIRRPSPPTTTPPIACTSSR